MNAPPSLAFRDPIHGFIEADELEAALIRTRPMQRLRSIRQLGLTHLVFPGAEHSRFGHALGTMHLAGRVYDTLARAEDTPLEAGPRARTRRLVRAAALLHDLGHAPFSHWAEDLFEDGIDHEEMSRRLLAGREIAAAFEQHGDGLEARDVIRLLGDDLDGPERLLPPIVSGELDVDKMDYLLRDSLFCGVRYGNFDLDQVIATVRPLSRGAGGDHRLGIDAEGLHAVEGLILARYYMFTQVYFHVTGKALELHLNEW
ncbi:MAG: HD domain-containing protein, partial [Acidobacteriota bacterium]|nr:HD domain-containing protein [Acidobacteriota bacterium]